MFYSLQMCRKKMLRKVYNLFVVEFQANTNEFQKFFAQIIKSNLNNITDSKNLDISLRIYKNVSHSIRRRNASLLNKSVKKSFKLYFDWGSCVNGFFTTKASFK